MRWKIFAVVTLCLVGISGLTFAGSIGSTDREVRAIADPLLDNILDAMKKKNYDQYSRGFDDTMREAVTEAVFLKSIRQLQSHFGTYQSRTYLGFLKKGEMTAVLWKAVFDETPDDVLIRLVVSKRAGRYVITNLWFQ